MPGMFRPLGWHRFSHSQDGRERHAAGAAKPYPACGCWAGGVVDVAAFALRVAVWSLKRPHPRNTIILDEPMRFLSADLQGRASTLLQEISKKLNIQFFIISHEENLFEAADRVFRLSKKEGVSCLKEIE